MFNLFMKNRLNDGEIELVQYGKHKDSEPDGWGNSLLYDIVELATGKIVGRCDLRMGTGRTLYYAGNIGYSVYMPYRGHHYAAKACILMYGEARKRKMKEIIITCNPDNLSSYRTCELAGCKLKEIVDVPKDHDLYFQGDRQKAIFIKNLTE